MTQRLNRSRFTGGRRPQNRRRGAVTIIALTALLIVMALVGSMLKSALRSRRQLHTERDRRQTELLLQAGAGRAALRLKSEPDFRGDTWSVSSDAIAGQGAGQVTTEVSQAAESQFWQVHVVAEYPLDRDFPIRRSQTFQLTSTIVSTPE